MRTPLLSSLGLASAFMLVPAMALAYTPAQSNTDLTTAAPAQSGMASLAGLSEQPLSVRVGRSKDSQIAKDKYAGIRRGGGHSNVGIRFNLNSGGHGGGYGRSYGGGHGGSYGIGISTGGHGRSYGGGHGRSYGGGHGRSYGGGHGGSYNINVSSGGHGRSYGGGHGGSRRH